MEELNRIKVKLGNPNVHIDYILNDIQTLFNCTANNALGEEYEYKIDINKKHKPIKFDRQTLSIRNKYCDARKLKKGANKLNRVIVASRAYKKAVSKAKANFRKKVIKKLRNARTKNKKIIGQY